MALITTVFDPAEIFDDEESQQALIADALESGDPDYIKNALETVERAKRLHS